MRHLPGRRRVERLSGAFARLGSAPSTRLLVSTSKRSLVGRHNNNLQVWDEATQCMGGMHPSAHHMQLLRKHLRLSHERGVPVFAYVHLYEACGDMKRALR